jgi:hypothetical protein
VNNPSSRFQAPIDSLGLSETAWVWMSYQRLVSERIFSSQLNQILNPKLGVKEDLLIWPFDMAILGYSFHSCMQHQKHKQHG